MSGPTRPVPLPWSSTQSRNTQPQPSLYFFTAKYFSVMRVNGTTKRADLPQDVTKATAAQLLAALGGNAFTAQSGAYDVAGGKITFKPMVARNLASSAPNIICRVRRLSFQAATPRS